MGSEITWCSLALHDVGTKVAICSILSAICLVSNLSQPGLQGDTQNLWALKFIVVRDGRDCWTFSADLWADIAVNTKIA